MRNACLQGSEERQVSISKCCRETNVIPQLKQHTEADKGLHVRRHVCWAGCVAEPALSLLRCMKLLLSPGATLCSAAQMMACPGWLE
jgi:hypothetical protein